MLRIAFFGTPDFAVPSLEALRAAAHDIVVVVTQPDRPRGRGQHVSASPVKRAAEAANIAVWQPDRLREAGFLDALQALAPDLGVVAAYGKILPEALLAIPRLGFVNVHASLLPRHRGAAPIERAITQGDEETGVTIMRVVKALDAGPMLSWAAVPIEPDDTAIDVGARLAEMGAALLIDAVHGLEHGTAIEYPQDDARATYAPRIVKADGQIEWDQPAIAIHDKVRALHPWPHAFTFRNGTRLVIHQTRPYPSLEAALEAIGGAMPQGETLQARVPGTVLPAPRGHLLVAADGGTVVEVLRLQEEGRRVLSAREFLAGHPLPPGTRFSAPELL
jgi:methionyl-tRNA formyltransferase